MPLQIARFAASELRSLRGHLGPETGTLAQDVRASTVRNVIERRQNKKTVAAAGADNVIAKEYVISAGVF
jgi:hypothetical protein